MIDFGYEVVRSQRRTMSVTVNRDGNITVRVPSRTSVREIEKFVQSKSDWVKKHLNSIEKNKLSLSSVTEGRAVLVKGKEVPLKFCGVNTFTDREICVKSIKNLKKLYVDNLGGEFLRLFEHYRAVGGFDCNGVEFNSYKSRWGCCGRDKRIFFNYKLLMLPISLWGLVIVHELCHTVYMNHSKQFYGLLEKILPSARTLRRGLKQYSLVCSMY